MPVKVTKRIKSRWDVKAGFNRMIGIDLKQPCPIFSKRLAGYIRINQCRIERGLVDSAAIDVRIDTYETNLVVCYYRHWLNALKRIYAAKGLVGSEDLQWRKATWRRAYFNMPHGRPVELSATGKGERRREKP